MLNNIKRLALSTVVAAVLIGLICANVKAETEQVHIDTVADSILTTRTEAAKPDALDAWIHKLMLQESGGRTTFVENGGLPYIIDVNGLRSYGCLQFQEPTFNSYAEAYGITGHITDCSTQKKLARAMIEDSWQNWRHWYNSVKVYGVGFPPRS